MKTIINRLRPHLSARQLQVCIAKNQHLNADIVAEKLGIKRPAVLNALSRSRTLAEANGVLPEFELLAGYKPSGKVRIDVYELLSTNPDRTYSSSEVTRLIGAKCAAELKNLVGHGYIEKPDYDRYRAVRKESINYWLKTPWRLTA